MLKKYLTKRHLNAIIQSERGKNKTSKNEKERFKMTKKEMIDYIEASGMVINFSRSYFNKMLRARVEEFYNDAVRFCNK